MKLKFSKQQKNSHTNIVYNVNWGANNQIYSFSDDKKILNWDINGEHTGKFMDMDQYYVCSDWSSSFKAGSEILVMGSVDGQLKSYSSTGKLEKSNPTAHGSCIICLQWSPDGNTLATGGEDGHLKTWSKNLEMRHYLVKGESPIYALKWNHDASFLIYATENSLNIEPVLKGGLKTFKWKAHDELVTCVDWNPANKLIISGGEDKKYKIWDQYGRNLYVSYQLNSVITSISWAPNGEYFSVGSFNSIRLCSKTGWNHCISKTETGGILGMSWSNDSTLLAVAGVRIFFLRVMDLFQ